MHNTSARAFAETIIGRSLLKLGYQHYCCDPALGIVAFRRRGSCGELFMLHAVFIGSVDAAVERVLFLHRPGKSRLRYLFVIRNEALRTPGWHVIRQGELERRY